MSVGQIGTLAATSDFTLTRDQLIRAAFEEAKVIAEGEALTPEQLNIGIVRLGLIVRELDGAGNWVWTRQEAAHLSLKSGVGVYDVNAGLPMNISEIVSIVYRSSAGHDSAPLKILTADAYERIPDKLMHGEPCAVYLTNQFQLERRRLYIWPFPLIVTAQSMVIGSDGNHYKCIYPHESSSVDRPVMGENWRMVWELSGGAVSNWASGSAYTVAESMRMVIKRPIFDFDAAGNTPDFPMQWSRMLMLRVALDVGSVYGASPSTLDAIAAKIKGAFTDIFPSTRPQTNNIHNKTQYF